MPASGRPGQKKREGQTVAIEGDETATGPSVDQTSVARDFANKLLLHLPEDLLHSAIAPISVLEMVRRLY